ncbi:hypothetical protein AXG93_2982s1070 [Marchantia polymorpha subsp. ruderalis]|uniref:Uncharacterized protein n=1 Tax=Marchantia polymorpha subsp. ruderalis TaxID=1480154 RepID=A0A176VXU1_MARPO|nr:hypothetical protein AXG93_2982s1070 [Marchantia polymorpha subsp. ruderalis]
MSADDTSLYEDVEEVVSFTAAVTSPLDVPLWSSCQALQLEADRLVKKAWSEASLPAEPERASADRLVGGSSALSPLVTTPIAWEYSQRVFVCWIFLVGSALVWLQCCSQLFEDTRRRCLKTFCCWKRRTLTALAILICTVHQLVEPNADERERAIGFMTGVTAAATVSEASHRQVLGQAIDLNCSTWIVSLGLAEQRRLRFDLVVSISLVSSLPTGTVVAMASTVDSSAQWVPRSEIVFSNGQRDINWRDHMFSECGRTVGYE